MTDYQLLKDHYDLVDFEILDGCWFYALTGIFDEYIEKYKHQKLVSKGALRELAKLFLNNLYGKMASSKDSSFKLDFYLLQNQTRKQGIYLLVQLSQVMQETLLSEQHKRIIMVSIKQVLFMEIQTACTVIYHQKK